MYKYILCFFAGIALMLGIQLLNPKRTPVEGNTPATYARVVWCLFQIREAEKGNDGVPISTIRQELQSVQHLNRLHTLISKRLNCELEDIQTTPKLIDWFRKHGHPNPDEAIYSLSIEQLCETLEKD